MGLHAHRPFRPRGKEAAAAASFPLGEGLGWTNVQPRLIYARVVVSVYTASQYGWEGTLGVDTDTRDGLVLC